MIVTDYPDAKLIENLAHNLDVNLNVEERRRVEVQVGFSRLACCMFFFVVNILIGIYLGQARSSIIRTPIPVLKIRPYYSLRSCVQPLTGT